MRKKRVSYLSWGVFLVLCALGAGYGRLSRSTADRAAAALPERELTADSFLLLRMPEITSQYESGIETMKSRMDEWLSAVTAAGFRPMLLTEALRRLQQEEKLPERTVVFFFSPGYRRTFEIAAPIFERHRCPAVYLTDRSAMERSDRRYLTFHATRLMKASGRWDVGFVDRQGRLHIGRSGGRIAVDSSWSPVAGALALNRRGDLKSLNFLAVNADWNAAELVDRLRVESPADGAAVLGKAVIHSREWGVTLAGDHRKGTPFDLRAPLSRRGTKLFWMGTRGRSDFSLSLSAASLTGELWLQCRFDETSGSGINVIMSGRSLVAEERKDGRKKRLLSVPLQRSFEERPFSLEASVRGARLTLRIDGRSYAARCSQFPAGGRGLVGLYLTGRIRGIARARGIRLAFTPLVGIAAGAKEVSWK